MNHLSKEVHLHLVRCCSSTSMTKHITTLTTLRAFEEAHVLN